MVAIERVQGATQESGRRCDAHVDAGVEQFGRDCRRERSDRVEAGPSPIIGLIDGGSGVARQNRHCAWITVRSRYRVADAEARRAALVGEVGDMATLPRKASSL